MSDTLKIELENIQAIEKATVEVEGFTAVVGRSNSGKSSIIRGLSAAFTNKSPKSLYRRGSKKSRVSIDDDVKNIHIEWEKGASVSPSYKLNGEDHTKVGKEVPSQVQDWGFKDVKVNDDTLEVQFAKQHKYLFLLDKSGSFVADFISKITKVDVLSGALKDCESDLRATAESIKAADAELEHLAIDISKFGTLDACGFKVGDTFEAYKVIQAIEKVIGELCQFEQELETCKASLTALKGLPEISSCDFDINGLNQMCAWIGELDEKKNEYVELKKVQECIVPEVTIDLSILSDMDAYLKLAAKAEVELPEIEPLSLDMSEIKEIDPYVGQADVLKAEILDATTQINDTTLKLQNLEKELDDVVDALGGVCPFCKGRLANGCMEHAPKAEKVFHSTV